MTIILLAKFDPFERAENYAKATRTLFADAYVVFAVGAIVLALFIIWAKYLRHPRKRVSGGERVYRGSASQSSASEHDDSRRRYKRRVRRREHRGRNPTIAETGGLPPLPHEPDSDPSSSHAS